MMRTMFNRASLVILTNILLIFTIFLFGCVSTQPKTQTTPTAVNVRTPDGIPETFWNKFSWSDFTPEEQALWGKLGWKEESWKGKAPPPPTEEMGWSELSSEERTAAEQLGYSRFYWDSN